MSSLSGRSSTARIRSRMHPLVWIAAAATAFPACKPTEKKSAAEAAPPAAATAVASTSILLQQLAEARIDAAKTKLDQKHPDEALVLLVSALKSDPASEEARTMAEAILAGTVWNWPVLTLEHHLPVDQVTYSPPSSLWVSLGGGANTTVRWNLDSLRIENVLFPSGNAPTRSLVFGPGNRSVVIERGPSTLLCDARTLKPIREIGSIPDFLTPASVLPFSPDGLLFANPCFVSETDHSIVWHLRDAATGQIIRSSEPVPANGPRPLAAFLDRAKLRVLHGDGSLLEMPISPVEPEKTTPMPEPATLLGAQFSLDGNAVLTLRSQGPHDPPQQSIVSYSDLDDGSLETDALVKRFSWSKHPTLWNGLMSAPDSRPYTVEADRLQMLTSSHASVVAGEAITAASFGAANCVVGTTSGSVTIHHFLPLPAKTEATNPPVPLTGTALGALESLCGALSGIRYDEKERTFVRLTSEERLKDFESCDFTPMSAVFPALDFSAVASEMSSMPPRSPEPEATLPLWNRLALADLGGKSWPSLLEKARELAETPWFRGLTAAVVATATHSPTLEDSPWLAAEKMAGIFQSDNADTILAAIRAAGGKGPAAANALALSLQSEHADWIDACLSQAEDLPPVLRLISLSRIAWIQGRKAAALSPWPEDFPTMAEIRRREDWEGWEQADFEPALDAIRHNVQEELTAIEVPENSTPEQRQAVAERLENPDTVTTVGKPRFALACMKAALVFASFHENAEAAFKLASTARNLGAPAEPCLRAEALALTATGDYQKAHERWVELITEHPVETQIPADYAEGAYTAFENADPAQAMIILTTGMHRYPQDPNFALRAGWVALLTANPDRAYDFLKAGKRIGYPAEKSENATALLVIAAAQAGFNDDATVYFNDLRRIDEAWNDPGTLQTLDWPEELKSTLLQFMH